MINFHYKTQRRKIIMSSTLAITRNDTFIPETIKSEKKPSSDIVSKVSAVFGAFLIASALILLKVTTMPVLAILIGVAGGVILTISLIALSKIGPEKQNQQTPEPKKQQPNSTTVNNNSKTTETIEKKQEENQIVKSNEPPSAVKLLLERFDKCWDPVKKLFNHKSTASVPGLDFNTEKFNATLKEYNSKFAKPVEQVDYKTDLGFIQKMDLPPRSKLFVRADLHGDLKSLIENLKVLQFQGLLDDNFKCTDKDVQLIFLGDYMDRGDQSLQIVELLARLKLLNPDQVHVIRGNHENIEQNKKDGGQNLWDHIWPNKKDDIQNQAYLTTFYESMPLSLYVCQADKNHQGEKEYVQLTHGTFELTTDPSELLDSDETNLSMTIPAKRELSERITKLTKIKAAPKELLEAFEVAKNETLEALDEATKKIHDHYQKQISEIQAALDDLKNIQLNEIQQANVKKMHVKMGALRIRALVETIVKRDEELSLFTTYNWGDVENQTYFKESRGVPCWCLSAKDVLHYLNASSDKHKVCLLIRGHQHSYKQHTVDDRVVVTTLPIATDVDEAYLNRYKVNNEVQYDRAYLIQTAPKVEDWKKGALLRARGASDCTNTDAYPLTSAVI